MPWHITTRLVKDRVLAVSVAERRVLAGTLLAIGEKARLVAFSAPSDRLEMVLDCERSLASRTCRDITSALRRKLSLPLPFARAWFEEVEAAQVRPVLRAVLTRLDHDPHREACNLPDLLGLRLSGRYSIGHALRWVDRRELLRWWGRELAEPGPAFEELPDAAAATLCLPDLRGRRAEVVDAKRAAVHVGRRLGARHAQLAELLELSERQCKRLSGQLTDPALLRAVELQLGLRQQLSAEGTDTDPELHS